MQPPSDTPSNKGADPIPTEMSADLAARIDHEMDQAMQEHNSPSQSRPLIRGPRVVQGGREHRTGTIVSVNPDSGDVFVEFGPKELGLVEGTQFKSSGPPPAKGDVIEVVVQRFEAKEQLYICALPGAVQKADWEMLEPGQTIEARITGVVKGGLELEVAGHRAFMPASQVSLDHVTDLSVFVGDKITCQVDRVDRRGKGNIVLSRRNLLKEERRRQAEELRSRLEVGQTIDGVVRRIAPFGVFVDIGGVDGLVHVSDLSHQRIAASEKAIGQHVKEGQKLRVQILKLDWDANRISLGVKQLEADPLQAAAEQITEGAVVTGRVRSMTDFGAFIELAPGVEGLVHISEMAWKRINHPSEVLSPDEVVQVKVLKIDHENRRISLSIRQLKEAPQRPADAPSGHGGQRKGGRGKGRGERDDRTPEEILKETPEFRRLREQARQKAAKADGGLGSFGALGEGLGNLKL